METLSIVLAGLYLFFSLLVLGVVYTLLRNRLPVQHEVQPVTLLPEVGEMIDKYIAEIKAMLDARAQQPPEAESAAKELAATVIRAMDDIKGSIQARPTPEPNPLTQAPQGPHDYFEQEYPPYEMPHDVTQETTAIHHALMIPQRDRLTITNDMDATFHMRWPLFAVEVLLDIRDLLRAKR